MMDPEFLALLQQTGNPIAQPGLANPLITSPVGPANAQRVAQHQPVQPRPELQPSLLDRIFSGPRSEHLSGEEEVQAFKDARLRAGLQMVLASGPAPVRQNLAQILAQGMLAGRQAFGEFEQAAIERAAEEGRQMIRQQFGQASPEELGGAIQQLLAHGLVDEAKAGIDLLAELRQQNEVDDSAVNRQRFEAINPETGEPEVMQIDPRTGQVFGTGIQPIPEGTFERTFQIVGADGLPHLMGVVRGTGEQVDLGVVPGGGGQGGMQERINQNLAQAMQQAETNLSAVDEELASPIAGALANMSLMRGPVGFLAKAGLSLMPEAQLAAAARERWVAPAVRLMSGAQMTEQERQTYRVAYTPQPFDNDEVRRQKTVARALLANLFADQPNGMADLSTEEARQVLNTVLAEAERATLQPSSVPEENPYGDYADLVPRGN